MKTRKIACALLAVLLFAFQWAAVSAETEEKNETYLNLDGQRLNYKQVKAKLEQYPNLEKVDMYDTPVSRTQAEELESLYPGVTFGWTLKIGTDHLVRTDATAFSTLHFSGDPGHMTKDIAVLRYCKNLRALDFGHNLVNDLTWLEGLTDLRVLIIAINRVEDISPLAKLTKLEYLEMFSNEISDLSPLRNLTHLMDLNIGYNKITDFTPRYGRTWLRGLWLGKANRHGKETPEETIETLKKMLPDCQIDWKSQPTLGGWREHPHYDVIHKMFAGSEYIPFSDSFPDYPEDDEDEDLQSEHGT